MRHPLQTASTVILAAAVGAGLALLFAPRTGERTRRLIRNRAKLIAKELQEQLAASAQEFCDHTADSTRYALKRIGRRIKPLAA